MAENIIRDEAKYRDRRSLKLKEYGFNVLVSKNVPKKVSAFFSKEKYTLRTNGMGFIENGNGTTSSNRICIMGDSFSECFFMEEGERFVSVCERELNALGHDVELLNCSMVGTNIFHAVFLMLAKVLPLGVSQVVYFTSNSDYQSSRMKGGDFFAHDRAYSIFNDDMEKREREKPAYRNYYKLLNTLYSVCRLAGVELLLALRPFEEGDRRSAINTATEKFAVKKGITCIDLRPFSCDDCYYDHTHLKGHASVQLGKYLSTILHDILTAQEADPSLRMPEDATNYLTIPPPSIKEKAVHTDGQPLYFRRTLSGASAEIERTSRHGARGEEDPRHRG